MYKKIVGVAIILLPLASSAQLGRFIDRAKNKVDQRVDNKVDKEIDKTLDAVEGKSTPSTASTSGGVQSVKEESPKEQGVKAFSKFDFVPGERILYSEDFSQDAVGELPLTWNSSGKGEVMTLNNQQGKWLRVYENNTYLTGNRKTLGKIIR